MFASVKTADGIQFEFEGASHEINSVLGHYGVSDLVDQVHANETNHAITVVEAIFGEVNKVNEISFSTPTDEELDAASDEAVSLVKESDLYNAPINDSVWDGDDDWGYGHWPY